MAAFTTWTISGIPWASLWIGGILHVTLTLGVAYHCLRHRREPVSTLLWIFLAWSFPLFGVLAYLMLGVDRVAAKGFIKAVTDRRLGELRRDREKETLPLAYWRTVRETAVAEPSEPLGAQFNQALDSFLGEHPLLGGNRIELLLSGHDWYPRLFAAIRAAQHHVHLQSFIIRNDSVGRALLSLLERRAAEGIEVRLLYDRFGSTQAVLSGLFRRYRGRHARLRLSGWTQANPLKRGVQINLRNHRKIAIVDGQTAFVGGINLHLWNLSVPGREAIRDYHFEIEGPIAQELQYTFLQDWHFMTGEAPEHLLTQAYFPPPRQPGGIPARVINGGPSMDASLIADTFFLAITAAKRQVLVVTPYFVPTPALITALKTAARRRVDVRLVVPGKNNHVYAGWAGRALYEELLDAGVRIFEKRPPFLHAKAMIVDDTLALVGTANLNSRSLRLDYETLLAIIDQGFVDRLKSAVIEEFQRSDEISAAAWRRRSTRQRCLENLCHLMAPVL